MPPPPAMALPSPEIRLSRATDRTRTTDDRSNCAPVKRRARLSVAASFLIGPGLLAMLGENDGPSMLSYAASGAAYGIGFFLPFIALTFGAAYVVQEMAMRLAAVTGQGYGELVTQRFGRTWGWISAIDLVATNYVTLITEVIAIDLGMGYFGVPAWAAAACAVALVAFGSLSGRYARWERIAAGLAIFNLLFVAVAMISHPSARGIATSLITWRPLPSAGVASVLMLIASNIGATVTPWMLFFQQSASVDKGVTGREAIRAGRLNTGFGALLAALCGGAALIAAASLFTHGIDMGRFLGGVGFAQALRPLVGNIAAGLFALGLVQAGAVALLTISASSAYATGEMVRETRASFNASAREAPLFHAFNIGFTALAALVTVIPGAPLMAIALNANLLSTILMPGALVLLLVLANDREIMGTQANSRLSTTLGVGICMIIMIAATAATTAGFLASIGFLS